MSGNMWALLRKIRDKGGIKDDKPSGTMDALFIRGLVVHDGLSWWVTDLGRMVCDAFTEGQESVK